MHSIEQLLQAAEYLDRREREAEHGYASTLPMPDEYSYSSSKKRSKSKKTQGNRKETPSQRRAVQQRSTHNELEKNRRAHLRHCLERLKDLVPLGVDSSRHTTLGLLTKARSFIKNLEEKERKAMLLRDQLECENRHLRRRLEQLNQLNQLSQENNHNHGLYRVRQERSISECSTSTNLSSSSMSSTSSIKSEESDEIDIIGGFQSDSDDRLSVESLASDGSVDRCRRYSNNFSDDSGVSSGLSNL